MKPKRYFRLPQVSKYRPKATRATVQAMTSSSPKRIVENTQVLKDLAELLARPLP